MTSGAGSRVNTLPAWQEACHPGDPWTRDRQPVTFTALAGARPARVGEGPRERKDDFSVRHHWASGEGSGQVSPSWAYRGVCSRPPPRSHRGGGHGRVRHEGLPDPGGRPGGGQPHRRRNFKGGNYRAHSVFKVSLILFLKMCFFMQRLLNTLQRTLSLHRPQENANALRPPPCHPGH